MRVAVTGGAGYIGSALVRGLLENGDTVVSVDNLTRGDYRYLEELRAGSRLKLVVGDVRDLKLLREAFTGADAVAHLAALPGLILCEERPEEAVSVNIYGTRQVLEAARGMDVEKVIFCSSAAVYGVPETLPVVEGHPLRPLNLYGVTKLAGEKLMGAYHENYGMETAVLRFGNVFGVGLYTSWDTVIPKFVMLGLEGKPLTIYGDGESSRDFVHVEDIVHALILALGRRGIGGEAFNVGGETVRIGRLAEIISEELERATGRGVGVVHLPPRPGETKMFSYRMDKIEEALGYRPRWSVRRGVQQLIEYRMGLMRSAA
ncbi:MAG: NAD-dependent epimerase/dehydratase family protein [Candidatus Bathyarchaeia archaeon]